MKEKLLETPTFVLIYDMH